MIIKCGLTQRRMRNGCVVLDSIIIIIVIIIIIIIIIIYHQYTGHLKLKA